MFPNTCDIFELFGNMEKKKKAMDDWKKKGELIDLVKNPVIGTLNIFLSSQI